MTSMTDPTAPVPVERTEEIPWIAPHAQSPTTPAPAAPAPPSQPTPEPAWAAHVHTATPAPPVPTAAFPPAPPSTPPASAPAMLPPSTPPRRSGPGWGSLVVVATAAAVAGGIGGGVIGARLDDGPSAARPGNSNVGQVGSSTGPTAGPGATARPEGSVASIAAKATPSVVTIRVAGADGSGTGSGWVYDDKGHIVTNNHVVASAANSGEITVILTDGSQRKATIVGRDVSYDLAVLKVDPQGLTPLPVGVSADVLVGDPVIAVGAPLGLESTVTTGIISALNRPVTPGDDADRSFINALQTDAAINPGNSGGPLLDMQGRVIGVNSAIARVSGDSSGSQSGSIGVGFAIPSDQVKTTADQLIATGKAVHPVIGVFLDREYTGEGVRIAADEPGRTAIVPGGPADKAGLKAGDVILTFDGRPMTSPDALVVAIRSKAVGDSVELGIERGGQKQQVTMVLKADTQ